MLVTTPQQLNECSELTERASGPLPITFIKLWCGNFSLLAMGNGPELRLAQNKSGPGKWANTYQSLNGPFMEQAMNNQSERYYTRSSSYSPTDEEIAYAVRAAIYRTGQARERGLPATLTVDQWLSTLNHFNWNCIFCLMAPYEILEFYVTFDEGGGATVENCFPICECCHAKRMQVADHNRRTGNFLRRMMAK